jgi:hypothetical protein
MLKEPDSGSTRGFIWIATTSIIVGIISGLLQSLFLNQMTANSAPFSFLYLICGVIAAPIGAIIGISISTGIYHLIAKLFGGSGSWSNLLYCLSAVVAPTTLIGGVVSLFYLLFSQIPVVIIIPIVVSVVLGIYALVLNVNAIRAAENIGTGGAIGTLIIPVFAIGICYLLVFIALIPVFIQGQ